MLKEIGSLASLIRELKGSLLLGIVIVVGVHRENKEGVVAVGTVVETVGAAMGTFIG